MVTPNREQDPCSPSPPGMVVIPSTLDRTRQGIGGIAAFVQALEPRLRDRGLKVTLLGRGSDPTSTRRELDEFIPVMKDSQVQGRDLTYALWRRRNTWSFPGDAIIHVQRPDQALGFPAERWPIVITFHGRHMRSWRLRWGALAGWVYRRIERSGGNKAAALIFVSRSDMASVLERNPEWRPKAHHVPVAVDLDAFVPGDRNVARSTLGLPPSASAVAWAGRIEREKGLPNLIQAVSQLPDCHLWIAGSGSNVDTCRRLAGERVRFLGPLDRREMVLLLQAAHVVGLASEYEGLPTAILEAWACGRPVVAPPVGDVSQLLASGGGVLVPDNRPESLAQGIRDALATTESEAELRARSRPFGWDAVLDQLLGVYRQAVAQHAATSARRPE